MKMETSSNGPIKQYRYPGVQPFNSTNKDLFFGRRIDTDRFLSLLLSEQCCVLYGKSGHGKSSLLQAGVVPALEEKSNKHKRHFVPIMVRFNNWAGANDVSLFDKFRFHLDTRLKKGGIPLLPHKLAELPDTLWGAVRKWSLGSDTGVVMIFDQFEEFFSYPADQQNSFKQQLAELLYALYPQFVEEQEENLSSEQIALLSEPMDIRAVFSIRADRLSDLDQLKDCLPAILHKRFELRALTTTQAKDAILFPAAIDSDKEDKGLDRFFSPSFTYEEQALQVLINELSGNNQSSPNSIEAFHLQIVCAAIEKNVCATGERTIGLDGLPDFKTVYARYYQDKIEELPKAQQVACRKVLENGLLLFDPRSNEVRRLSRDADELAQTFSIAPEWLKNLERTYLIRREVNTLGGYNYEISHDALLSPILDSRKEAEAEILKKANEEAVRMADEAKKRAENEAAQEKKLRESAEKAKRKANWFAVGAIGFALIAGILFWNLRDKNRQVVDGLVKEAENSILLIDYTSAAEKLKNAAALRQSTPKFQKMVLDVAFFWNEAGKLKQAKTLLKSTLGASSAKSIQDLRVHLKSLNPIWYDSLKTRYCVPRMVKLSGGEFNSHAADGQRIQVSSYNLASTEVTVWQYNLFLAAKGQQISDEKKRRSWDWQGDNPMVYVSWYEAVEYANWLSKRQGLSSAYAISSKKDTQNASDIDTIRRTVRWSRDSNGYRLPTQAEWEYAARGGRLKQKTAYPGSDRIQDVVWYTENSQGHTQPVAKKPHNGLGIYDLCGNVWEWCWDWDRGMDRDASIEPKDPQGPPAGEQRVIRGGAWANDSRTCRIDNNNGKRSADSKTEMHGFRLAQSLR